jgi:thymidylate synthase ThyX
MKVTQVAICPSEASRQAGRPALTPELLAASGARYSRNNEGLEAILSKIDPNNLEKSVDSIFRMVDYGHQSIADMVPVAMFIDGISIWLAYHVWSLCPTAGGQESSTRYLKLSAEGLIAPEKLGIPAEEAGSWTKLMVGAFEAYQSALHVWEEVGNANPALMGIPQSLLSDSSDSAQKKVQRMKRNYAFDRARYFMPVGAATNIMMVMSARAWVQLCQQLLAHPLPEPRRLGEAIRDELAISAPRMIRHAKCLETTQRAIESEFQKVIQLAANGGPVNGPGSATPYLEVMLPAGATGEQMAADLAQHQNRYAPIGSSLQRTTVRFGWSAIGFAEIRDLNRHRTGSKYCPQVPRGFYAALDQLSPAADPRGEKQVALTNLTKIGHTTNAEALLRLRMASPSYVYWTLLGTEYPFEHVTTADKFIYEAELRTGLGAHFRYAKHLRDVLALWYEKFPATRKLILEGDAEPE